MSEAERALRLCAACLYCDALCPVFPALADKRAFAATDLHYLAHLCHNCRACWDACQYAPPHPFALNLPAILAEQRRLSYAECVWPRLLAPAFRRPALGAGVFALVALATMAALLGFGVSWAVLSALAGGVLLAALVSLVVSSWRFWRRLGAPPLRLRTAIPALRDIVTLRHFGGSRRRWHHAMVSGIALDLVATLSAAALQHVYGLAPPYPLLSLPVLAGVVGGVLASVGALGLLAHEAGPPREDREPGEAALNVVLLSALALVALSGLALLVLRATAAMTPLLVFHLGVVCGLFALLPVSKLLHAPFRALALWRAAAELRPPRAAARRSRRAGNRD